MDASPRSTDELLAAAAQRIARLTPLEAAASVASGALLVDVRTQDARRRDGVVPGAVPIPRTVLEWRLEPGGAFRTPHAGDPKRQVILLCDHGYSTVLAAATLQELGLDATDVIGGFEAWRAAGLPVVGCDDPPLAPGERQGMRGPD